MTVDFSMDENGVALLQVNRPERRNALDWEAQKGFAEAVTAVSQSPSARILIITGTGDKAFISGGDLKVLSQDLSLETGKKLYKLVDQALTQLTQLPIPVIGAINGDAFGGGCEVLTACDLRIAVPSARFSFAQIRNGLTTGWGGTGRLVRLLGHSRAMELLLTGRVFDVFEAKQLGFVHRVVEKEEDLMTAVYEWANQLIRLPQHALASLKSLVYTASSSTLTETNQKEKELFIELFGNIDHTEAVQAFVQKRKPQFNRK